MPKKKKRSFRWFSMSHKQMCAWKKKNQSKLQTAGLCGCARVVLEAGSTPLPAGYCPAADLAVSAVIRQRQATASWTPAAPFCVPPLCWLIQWVWKAGFLPTRTSKPERWSITVTQPELVGSQRHLVCIEWHQHDLCQKFLPSLLHCWLEIFYLVHVLTLSLVRHALLEQLLVYHQLRTRHEQGQLEIVFYPDSNLANPCLLWGFCVLWWVINLMN